MTGASCHSRRWVVSLPVGKVQPEVQALGPLPFWRLPRGSGTGPTPAVCGKGRQRTPLARLSEPGVEPKSVQMLPAGLCDIWQRMCSSVQSKEDKEEAECCEGKARRAPAEGSGSLRSRRGLVSPGLGQSHLESLQREKRFLRRAGGGGKERGLALGQGTGHKGTGHKEGSQGAGLKERKKPLLPSSFPYSLPRAG